MVSSGSDDDRATLQAKRAPSDAGGEASTDAFAAMLRALARAPDVRPAARLGVGDRVGERYEILARLGEGGMGVVYRAMDERLGREVALKLLHGATASGADGIARFAREARALAAIRHPNVVAIHDIGEHEGTPFLALELLEGETLRTRLVRGPNIDTDEVVRLGIALSAGLAAVHARGIVHRDMKPENVVLAADGTLKLLDFGLAKFLAGLSSDPDGAEAGSLATRSGVLLGTFAYMAPEQVRGGPVDARADVFALGAVLHELLVNRRTFARATPVETMHAVLTAEPEPLDVLPAVPPGLAAVVERCLAKAPGERFASAEEVAAALAAVARGEGPAARRPSTHPPPVEYARAGDIHIAYQCLGVGEPEIVVVPGFVSNIEALWDDPDSARFLGALASRARVVLFDKRGTGLSDRGAVDPPGFLEQRSDDVRAVLDAAGCRRALLFAVSEGAAIAIRVAATYPERVAGLVLYGGWSAWGANPLSDAVVRVVRDSWGTGATIDLFAPSVAADPAKRRWWARFERGAASPGAAADHVQMIRHLDTRGVLALVRVPTLIVHRRGDRVVPAMAGRYMADRIPGARLLELGGEDHMPMVGDTGPVLDAVLDLHADLAPALAPLGVVAWPLVVAGPAGLVRATDPAAALRAALAEAVASRVGLGADVSRPGDAEVTAVAARALAAPEEVLVTGAVRGLTIDAGFTFEDRGVHQLVPGAARVRLFAVGAIDR